MSEPSDEIDLEMVGYYSARADEYDDWYLRRGRYAHGQQHDQAWRLDLEAAATWLARRPFHGQIVELAAGTGWWSPHLAGKGQLTLYDAAPEPLEKARARLAGAGLTAQIQVRNAWADPDRSVDGLFAGFWISHVDRSRLDAFLARDRAGRPGLHASSSEVLRCWDEQDPGHTTAGRGATDQRVRD